ncbi:MAG: hypothetical protein ACRERE_45300 [Candidatus Entotheonellia bacterium]
MTGNAPNTPAPTLVFSYDDRRVIDGQSGTLTKGERFLWLGDRFTNRLIVVGTATDRVVSEIGLSGRVGSDPPPDILDVAPGDHSPGALARSGLGEFHHPAPPWQRLVVTDPRS